MWYMLRNNNLTTLPRAHTSANPNVLSIPYSPFYKSLFSFASTPILQTLNGHASKVELVKMFFLGGPAILLAFYCAPVFSQHAAPPPANVAERDIFSSIGLCKGSTCPTTAASVEYTSSSKYMSSSTSKTTLRSSTSSHSLPTSSAFSSTTASVFTGPYDPYMVTTTFTQPPECSGGIRYVLATSFLAILPLVLVLQDHLETCTPINQMVGRFFTDTGYSALAQWGTSIYNNIIWSGVNSAYTNCFPPQFYSSVLAKTSMGPFKALICPSKWESYKLNATYVVCCPKYVHGWYCVLL